MCVRAHEEEEWKGETYAELAKGGTERKRERERERERETLRERERRIRVQRADTVVKEPSSSLHLDTHKYKAQPFELPREEYHPFIFLPLPRRLSSSLLVAPATLDSTRLGSLPRWQSKFISRSCLFWTFHNIWPCFGIQHRPRRAPVTRRYGFEPSVMDGSLSSQPRIAASLLSRCPSFTLRLRPSFFIHPSVRSFVPLSRAAKSLARLFFPLYRGC